MLRPYLLRVTVRALRPARPPRRGRGPARFLNELRGPDYREVLRGYASRSPFIATDDEQRKERILQSMSPAPQHVVVSAFEGPRDYEPTEAAGGTGRLYSGRRAPAALGHGALPRDVLLYTVWQDRGLRALLPAGGAQTGQRDDRPFPRRHAAALACAAERAITFSCLLASHANTYTSRAIEAIRGRPRWLSETPSNVLRLLPTWSPTAPTLTRCGAQGQRGRRPDRALYYMYLRTRYARAAPTAMPRASCAINLATRWRFTYPPLLSYAGRNSL